MTEILLWEHLADLQLKLMMKYQGKVSVYMPNLYDSIKVSVDTDVLDREIDAAIVPFMQDPKTPYITLAYRHDEDGNIEIYVNTKKVCIINIITS